MISIIGNNQKSRIRKKETMKLVFYMKKLQRDKKAMSLRVIENIQ